MSKSITKFSFSSNWYIFVEYAIVIATLITMDKGLLSFRQLAYIITILIAILLSRKELIVLITLLVPLAEIMKFSSIPYTVLPFIICIYIVKRLLIEPKISKKFFILYSILLLISLFNSAIRYNSLIYPIPFFVYLIFAYMAIKDNCSKEVFNHAAIVYMISAILVVVGSHLFVNAAWVIGSYSDYMVRSVGFSTSWGFGQTMLIASAFTAVLYKKKKINLFVTISLISFYTYFGLQSGTFSIVIGLLLVMLFIVSSVENKIKLKGLAVITFPLLIFLIYIIFLQPMMGLRGGISDNGRIDIWVSYLQIFINNIDIMLFGVGGGCIQNYANIVGLLTTHNLMLEIIVQFGIIGSIFLCTLILYLCRNLIIRPSKNPNVLPLLVMLTFFLTQGGAGSETLFILLILSFAGKFDIDIPKSYCKENGYIKSYCLTTPNRTV